MHFLEYLKALERTLFEARADERAVDAVRVIILSDLGLDIGGLHYSKASTSQLTAAHRNRGPDAEPVRARETKTKESHIFGHGG